MTMPRSLLHPQPFRVAKSAFLSTDAEPIQLDFLRSLDRLASHVSGSGGEGMPRSRIDKIEIVAAAIKL